MSRPLQVKMVSTPSLLTPPRRSTGSPANSPRFSGSSDKCTACLLTVYPMERVLASNFVFHRACLRCNDCHAKLQPAQVLSVRL